MLTSYCSKWSKVWTPGGISVGLLSPSFRYPTYGALVPGVWHTRGYGEFVSRYQEQLSKLSPKDVWAELQAVATDDAIRRFELNPMKAARVEPVLLGLATAGDTPSNFCHRRLVAQWFQSELGVIVPEGYVDKKGNRCTVPNFDTLCRIEPTGRFVRLDKETNPGQGTLELF